MDGNALEVLNIKTVPIGSVEIQTAECPRKTSERFDLAASTIKVNPLKGRGVSLLHFAIQV